MCEFPVNSEKNREHKERQVCAEKEDIHVGFRACGRRILFVNCDCDDYDENDDVHYYCEC